MTTNRGELTARRLVIAFVPTTATKTGPSRRRVSTIYHAADLVELVRLKYGDGLTAAEAAKALFDTDRPSLGEVEKARRKLARLEADGDLVSLQGIAGGNDRRPTVWFLAARTGEPQ